MCPERQGGAGQPGWCLGQKYPFITRAQQGQAGAGPTLRSGGALGGLKLASSPGSSLGFQNTFSMGGQGVFKGIRLRFKGKGLEEGAVTPTSTRPRPQGLPHFTSSLNPTNPDRCCL